MAPQSLKSKLQDCSFTVWLINNCNFSRILSKTSAGIEVVRKMIYSPTHLKLLEVWKSILSRTLKVPCPRKPQNARQTRTSASLHIYQNNLPIYQCQISLSHCKTSCFPYNNFYRLKSPHQKKKTTTTTMRSRALLLKTLLLKMWSTDQYVVHRFPRTY